MKNDKVKLNIIDMTRDGLGVAKKDSKVYFVKDGIIGDEVMAIITKENGNDGLIFAKVIEILVKSKYRVPQKCAISNKCGGCQIMQLKYEEQLELKKNYVLNVLNRIGHFSEEIIKDKYEGIIGMKEPYAFRNKMQIPFCVRDEKIITGFYAGRTHYIIENENCITGFNESNDIILCIKNYCTKNNYSKDYLTIYDEKTNTGVLREVMIRKGNVSNEISVTLIVNDKKLEKKKIYESIVKALILLNINIKTITLNINTNRTNVLFGNENIIIYGDGYIQDEILGYKFMISPESFYQVNKTQTRILYDTAIDMLKYYLKGDKLECALDLYCGIGTITLLLSAYCKKIIGVEIVESAILNAKNNARINGISNATFKCLDAGQVSFDNLSISNENIELVSVDPPRKGIDKATIDLIFDLKPRYVLYISCDPATLARDLDILCHSNDKIKYDIKHIKSVDMFPHTMHIENVVLLCLNR